MDSSSKTRLDILNNSLAAIDNVDVLIGKGLGTFNSFYEKAGFKKELQRTIIIYYFL